MIAESERLILRRFKISDVKTFLEYRNDPQVALYQEFKSNLSLEEGLKFIERMQKISIHNKREWIQIAFEFKQNSTHIGDCGIKRFDKGRQAEIGISISRDYWRQGLGLEGLSSLFTFAFTELNVNRIIAISDTRNLASTKLLAKLSMRKEGHTIESYYEANSWTNEFIFAILKREWTNT